MGRMGWFNNLKSPHKPQHTLQPTRDELKRMTHNADDVEPTYRVGFRSAFLPQAPKGFSNQHLADFRVRVDMMKADVIDPQEAVCLERETDGLRDFPCELRHAISEIDHEGEA